MPRPSGWSPQGNSGPSPPKYEENPLDSSRPFRCGRWRREVLPDQAASEQGLPWSRVVTSARDVPLRSPAQAYNFHSQRLEAPQDHGALHETPQVHAPLGHRCCSSPRHAVVHCRRRSDRHLGHAQGDFRHDLVSRSGEVGSPVVGILAQFDLKFTHQIDR